MTGAEHRTSLSSLRVAALIDLSPRKLGSLENWLVEFVREGRRRGHEIDVFGREPVHEEVRSALSTYGSRWFILEELLTHPLRAIRRLRHYDVLHLDLVEPRTFLAHLAYAALPAGIVLRDSISGPPPGGIKRRSEYLSRMRTFVAPWRVHRVAAISDYVVRRDRRVYAIHPDRYRTVYGGIDVDRFRPRLDGAKDSIPEAAGPERVTILVVANLHWIKGVNYLIDAVARLQNPRIQLRIVGDGEEGMRLRAQARDLGIAAQTEFVGLSDRVQDHLHEADIFVHPCVWDEAFGLTIAEAMACGKPVIATGLGGIPELIEHQVSGLLVPPANPSRLADAIQLLVENPALRKALGAAARARAVERFDLRRSAREHLDLCEEVAAERGKWRAPEQRTPVTVSREL